MDEDPLSGYPGKPKAAPRNGITLLAIFLCFSLTTAGASMLVEGLARQSFGWIRYFGAVSLPERPIAFAAVAVTYIAATIVPAWGMLVLGARLRRGWSARG